MAAQDHRLGSARAPGFPGAPRPGAGRGWGQQERLWWLLWSQCPGVGPARLRGVIRRFATLERAWAAPGEAFATLPGWSAPLLADLEGFRSSWGQDPLPHLALQLRGRRALLPGDGRWPQAVAVLPRPPLVLWWRGRGALWPHLAQRGGVAVVGTRRPSSHGLAMAHRLGEALAAAGWPVVSGLAEGIDGEAHRGCLAAGGAPVAVLGTPLERVYPRHHRILQGEVGERGLLISELAAGAAVLRGHFASRNRLLVALARAVVVVECPRASGALHSAELAWHQELPLWVVPADAARLSAAGSNRLLAQGATPLLDPADLIAQLGVGPLAAHARRGEQGASRPALPAPQAEVLEAVGGGASLEQLCLALGASPSQLAPQLLQLELGGHLRAEPGLQWRPRLGFPT